MYLLFTVLLSGTTSVYYAWKVSCMARSTSIRSKNEIMRFAPVSRWNSRGSQPHCFNKPVPVTMNPPDIHTPFLPPNLLPSRSSIVSVSTGIHKLTDETYGFIAQILVLQ